MGIRLETGDTLAVLNWGDALATGGSRNPTPVGLTWGFFPFLSEVGGCGVKLGVFNLPLLEAKGDVS